MPRKRTHALVGGGLGAVFALTHERGWLMPSDRAAFVLGGALGGLVGGVLPDVLDPPTCPGHRSWAHAILPTAFFGQTTWAGMNTLAENILAAADVEPDPLTRFGMFMVAGLVKGAAPGYLSHLALDACTPSCLPLLGRFN